MEKEKASDQDQRPFIYVELLVKPHLHDSDVVGIVTELETVDEDSAKSHARIKGCFEVTNFDHLALTRHQERQPTP